MKAVIKLELLPFKVPKYVWAKVDPGKKEDGFKEKNNQFLLSELDESTLNQMCEDFKRSVFKIAEKEASCDLSKETSYYTEKKDWEK